MTNKYVKKIWANTDDWSHDPAWLYENKPKKFQKYLQYYKDNFDANSNATFSGNPEKKKNDDDSDEEFKKPSVNARIAPPKISNNKLEFKQPPAAAPK